MGLIRNHRHRRLIPPLIFLLIISISCSANSIREARAQPSHNQAVQKTMSGIRAHMIGSQPPRCLFRCRGCGPCEAVQVPVTPQQQQKQHRSRRSTIYETRELLYSRGDDVTNYKPMGWKCRCGNLFFNP